MGRPKKQPETIITPAQHPEAFKTAAELSATAKLQGLAGGTWYYVGTLESCGIYKSFDFDVTRVLWVAKMAIDCDGSGGNPYNDPYFQPDTSLHYNGKALNPYEVPFIVVPPLVINCVGPVVLGSMGVCVNQRKGLAVQTVTGDVGPSSKIGEASCACAQRVGLDGNPNHGGTDGHYIAYMIFPGIAAQVDGITYKLQPS